MIDTQFIQAMAQYGHWQNTNILQAVDSLDETERLKDRGAFFGSINGTLNHLLWGDRIWMARFAGTREPRSASIPESVTETSSWDEYRAARLEMDGIISQWSGEVDESWLQGDLSWFSGALNRTVSKPKQLLVIHFFNHGTHHRGQVHAMLTAAGAAPGATDLPFQPE